MQDGRVRDVGAIIAGLHDDVACGEYSAVVVHKHSQLLFLGLRQVRTLPSTRTTLIIHFSQGRSVWGSRSRVRVKGPLQ